MEVDAPEQRLPHRILLVGMMGAGKSTVGRALAGRLRYAYLDSDEEVQRRVGLTVPEIFAARGEAAFRAEEKRVLTDALLSVDPAVVSVAGGAVLDPDSRVRIREGGTVVWLRADVDTLAGRVGTGQGRPLLGGNPAEALARLYEQRRPLYADLADLVIDVEHKAPDQLVEQILGCLT